MVIETGGRWAAFFRSAWPSPSARGSWGACWLLSGPLDYSLNESCFFSSSGCFHLHLNNHGQWAQIVCSYSIPRQGHTIESPFVCLFSLKLKFLPAHWTQSPRTFGLYPVVYTVLSQYELVNSQGEAARAYQMERMAAFPIHFIPPTPVSRASARKDGDIRRGQSSPG